MDNLTRRDFSKLGGGALVSALAGCSRVGSGNNSENNGSEQNLPTLESSYQDVISRTGDYVADEGEHYSNTNKVRIDETMELGLENNEKVRLREGDKGRNVRTEELSVHVFDGEPANYEECLEGEIPIFRRIDSEQELPEKTLSQECEGEEINIEGYVVDTYRRVEDWSVDEGYGFLVTDWDI